MQYSPDLKNMPKDANRYLRGFLRGKTILDMKLKQFKAVVLKANKQANKPKPLVLFFCFVFRLSDTFKNLFLSPLQFSRVTYSGQTLVERNFIWSQWSPGLLRLLCGACSVSERSTGCSGKDVEYWHRLSLRYHRRWAGRCLLCMQFDVHQWRQWLLNTFLGQTDAPFGGIFSFSVPERKPRCCSDYSRTPGEGGKEAFPELLKTLYLLCAPHIDPGCWQGKSCSGALCYHCPEDGHPAALLKWRES